MEQKPSTDHRAWNGPSYLPSRVMKREAEEFAMYEMTDSMTARLDHDGSS